MQIGHLSVPDLLSGSLPARSCAKPVVGFPLGFFDTLYHLPAVRHAIIASSFGIRFQGQGYFVTDGRMHRGSSGGPVVMRCAAAGADLPWRLLGVHSARTDMRDRDLVQDENPGLNCAWYADILMTLTEQDALSSDAQMGPRRGRGRPESGG